MRRPSIVLATLLAADVVAACSGAPSPELARTRDSAGARILEYDAAALDAADRWMLTPAPLLEIGATNDDEESGFLFSRVVSAGRLLDGGLMVAEWSTSDLRRFDETGRLRARLGRRGAGPGEFQRLSWVQLKPSGAATIFDASQRRLTRLNATGTIDQITTIEPPAAAAGLSGSVLGEFHDGSLLMRFLTGLPAERSPDRLSVGLVRDSISVYRVSRDGAESLLLGEFPGDEAVRVAGEVITQRPAPFGFRTVLAMSDSVWFVGTQETPEVRGFDADGALRLLIRHRRPGMPVTAELRNRWQAKRDREVAEIEARRRLPVEVIEAARFNRLPSHLPAFGDLKVDREGNLWVQDYIPFLEEADSSLWVVHGSDGAVRARISLPNVQILEIGEDYLVGVWPNADDVPVVRMYRVQKRER